MKFPFAKAALLAVTLAVTAGTAKADYTLYISDNIGDSATFDLTTGKVLSTTGTVNVSGAKFSQSGSTYTVSGSYTVGGYSFGNKSQQIVSNIYSTGNELDMTLNAQGIKSPSSLSSGEKLTVTLTDPSFTSLATGSGSMASSATSLKTGTDSNTTFTTTFNSTTANPTLANGSGGTTTPVTSQSSNTLSDSFTFTGKTSGSNTLQVGVEADVTVPTPAPSSAILALVAGLMFGLVTVYRRGFTAAVAA